MSLARGAARSGAPLVLLLATMLVSGAGCCDEDETIVVVDRGVVVGDFRSIADYLNDPTVQAILARIPRHVGSTPPDVNGEYTADGELTATTIPGTFPGDPFGPFFFCLGSPAGASLEARILDASVEDGGALSFIEGSGDLFTVFTAFRSVQAPAEDPGALCEIHEVVVISGRREADGSLSDLWIGQGVVGLVGNCEPLILGDFQIASTTAARTGEGCSSAPGDNEGLVELVVQNDLVNPIVVFVDYDGFLGPQPFVVFPGEVSQPSFVPPGFFLSFESLQPVQLDPQGNEVLMGEIVAGAFAQSTTPPGEVAGFQITNQVENEIYFAPLPVNQTGGDVFALVNTDPAVNDVDLLIGPATGCRCPLATQAEVHDLGYYIHEIAGSPGAIEPNVRFFDFATDTELALFEGPFVLEPSSGAVVLELGPGLAAVE